MLKKYLLLMYGHTTNATYYQYMSVNLTGFTDSVYMQVLFCLLFNKTCILFEFTTS